MPIVPELAAKAIGDRVAGRLGMDITATAWGIREVANSGLIRALRAASTERGRDPRDFTLFAFGGMGPAQALDVADELELSRVIVPPLPGLFSSLGLLFAEVEHHLVRTLYADIEGMDLARVNSEIARLVEDPAAMLSREGYPPERRDITVSGDGRYLGQGSAFPIRIEGHLIDLGDIPRLVAGFHDEHERPYGYRSEGEEVQIVAIRCVGRGLSDTARVPERLDLVGQSDWRASGSRRCYFGAEDGWVDTDVIARNDVSQTQVAGPLIVEEDNSLTVVPPG